MIVGSGEPPPHSVVNKNSESNEDCRSSSGLAHEKEPETPHMDEKNENVSSESHSVNYLEDLITLEDLVEPIRSAFNDNSDEFHNIGIQELDNDLSDASYVACITVVEIFNQSWNIITNKGQQNDSGEVAASTLKELFDRAWRVIKPKSRWRVPDPGSWTRNVAIKRRAEGLSYVTGKKCRQAKIPRAVDCSTCKYKCGKNFSAHDRETLCRIYWAQSFTAKKNMILNLIKVNPIKTTTLVRKRSTQRANTKQYFFKNKGDNHQVCQNFFCKTFCISPSVIAEAVKKKGELGYYTKDDLRGHHEPANKAPPELSEEIRNHIKQFPTMESHYLRKQTKRQYLDCKLSVSKLYELYAEICEKKNEEPASESLYRKVFCTEFNLGFFIPKKDQCLLCTKFSRLNEVEKKKCDKLQDEYQQHLKRKEICNNITKIREIAAILISFDKHSEWQSKEVKIRPKSGSMLLYSRKKVRYRRDGYCWKKRKDGKTTREDHMKLKVQGTECIYGCYVHSAILPTFHRRCYWLLQNPDIVLVHYLNVPYPDDNKLATVAPSLALWADKKEWTKDELVSQLKPMFFSEDEPDINNELEISTAETVEAIVGQLMEKQRAARAAALARQLECGCPDSTCQDSRTCVHPLRRIQAAKPPPSDHHVSSTTGPSPRPMSQPPRQYTRDHRPAPQPASPLLLSLGQIQGGGGLLILNGAGNSTQQHSSLVSPLSVTSFVCEEPRDRYRQQYKPTFVLKREIPDSQPSSCRHNSDSAFEVTEGQVEEHVKIETFERRIKTEPRSRNQVIASAPATPSRYPDVIERLESKGLSDHCDDTLVLLGPDGHLGSSHGFFDETLELSHEDIQKTLSANMPTCDLDRSAVRTTETSNVMVSGIDTMDFIESCEAVASPTHVVDDNVFVNLDAFDMLGDFPELEVLDPSTLSHNPVPSRGKTVPTEQNGNEKMVTDSPADATLTIADYSPEWAYPEGGVKVLVAGPWTETSDQYTVLFDNFPVPSILVQNGLLRCYCPAHEAGLAALQVARAGKVVSDTVVFEYKPGPAAASTSPASAPLTSVNFQRFSLLQRLQRLHGRLQVKTEPMDDNNQVEDAQLYSNPKFEERLVTFCRSLSARSSSFISEGFTTEPGEEGSTVLHLAAALGYTKLTTALLRWRQDDTSLALEKEVNLGARDCENFTPLMRASSAGHTDTALVLARWSAGWRCEAGATQAVAAARRAGHNTLATQLERIHPPSRDGVFLRPGSLSQKGRVGSLESNLVKRPSIDSGINMADAFRSSSAIDKPDGKLSARWERSMSLPLDSDTSEDSFSDSKIGRRMDLALCETAGGPRSESPLIDVEGMSDDAASPSPTDSPPPRKGEQDDRVFTLAEQIIAAMPERIKNESSSLLSGCGLEGGSGGGEDTLMVPLLDDTTTFNSEFSFEFCDNTYRYCGGSTPCSSGSVSPGSVLSPPPPSPRAPPPAHPATLQEFLNATTHFSNLTLNDREQRELYSAAITIQKAYRQYRGRQLQRRAAAAAITIQNCYRRYKQFAYLKQMHAAATVIQKGYRSYAARRRSTASTSQGQNNVLKRTYSQRRQNQAARKIQQFMRQSKIKLQSVRAENARVAQLSQDAHRSSQQPIISTPRMRNRIVDYLAPESPMDANEDLLLELLFNM